jgi:hypothetical protein
LDFSENLLAGIAIEAALYSLFCRFNAAASRSDIELISGQSEKEA